MMVLHNSMVLYNTMAFHKAMVLHNSTVLHNAMVILGSFGCWWVNLRSYYLGSVDVDV